MAVMQDADRVTAWAELMRALSDERQTCAITKVELRAAPDAVDQWVSDNAAAFNTALPVAARNGLTTAQKARLLMAVVQKRFTVNA